MCQHMRATAKQEMTSRPDERTRKLLAGVYDIDVERAVSEYLGKAEWERWRERHPEQLEEIVERIGEQLADNLLIDARLEEYVSENLKHTSANV